MKVIIFGGTGAVGAAVADELGQRHEVVRVGRTSGDLQADITANETIEAVYRAVGAFDAVVSATGEVRFRDLAEMTEEDHHVGIRSKLMGQINLVRLGLPVIADGGSFTLTTGVLSRDPIRGGASASLVNAAVDGFVRAAAIELPRAIRLNAVSPALLEESVPKYGAFFPGHEPVPARRAARAYAKSVEGLRTGQVFEVG